MFNVHTASYSELKAWIKAEIQRIGSNPFGYYHMKSTDVLRKEISEYLNESSPQKSVSTSVVEENAQSTINPPLQNVIRLLQEAISVLQKYVSEDCDCEKKQWEKELALLREKAFQLQAELG